MAGSWRMNDLLQAARAHPEAMQEIRRLVAFPHLPPGAAVPPVEVSSRDLSHLRDSDLAALRRLIADPEDATCADCGTPVPADPCFELLRCPPCALRAGRATDSPTTSRNP